MHTTMPTPHQTETMIQGPMTRARARQLNHQVNAFLSLHTNVSKNGILLNSCDDLIVLRNHREEPHELKYRSGTIKRKPSPVHEFDSDSALLTASTSNGHNFWSRRFLGAREYSLESSWNLLSDGSGLTPKFHPSRSETAKQVTSLFLSESKWALGLVIRVLFGFLVFWPTLHLPCPLNRQPHPLLGFGFCLD